MKTSAEDSLLRMVGRNLSNCPNKVRSFVLIMALRQTSSAGNFLDQFVLSQQLKVMI